MFRFNKYFFLFYKSSIFSSFCELCYCLTYVKHKRTALRHLCAIDMKLSNSTFVKRADSHNQSRIQWLYHCVTRTHLAWNWRIYGWTSFALMLHWRTNWFENLSVNWIFYYIEYRINSCEVMIYTLKKIVQFLLQAFISKAKSRRIYSPVMESQHML